MRYLQQNLQYNADCYYKSPSRAIAFRHSHVTEVCYSTSPLPVSLIQASFFPGTLPCDHTQAALLLGPGIAWRCLCMSHPHTHSGTFQLLTQSSLQALGMMQILGPATVLARQAAIKLSYTRKHDHVCFPCICSKRQYCTH